jgi:hypothetical protein
VLDLLTAQAQCLQALALLPLFDALVTPFLDMH